MAVQAAATSEAQGQTDDAEHARKSTTAVLWLAQLQLAGNVQSCCADNEWAFVDIRGHGCTFEAHLLFAQDNCCRRGIAPPLHWALQQSCPSAAGCRDSLLHANKASICHGTYLMGVCVQVARASARLAVAACTWLFQLLCEQADFGAMANLPTG